MSEKHSFGMAGKAVLCLGRAGMKFIGPVCLLTAAQWAQADTLCVDAVTGAVVAAQQAQVAGAAGTQIVCGDSASALGSGATALGPTATANTDASIAIGSSAQTIMNPVYAATAAPTRGERGIAIGPGAINTITSGVALGFDAQTLTSAAAGSVFNPHSSIAIGSNARAWGNRTIAIGEKAGDSSDYIQTFDNILIGQQAGWNMQGSQNAVLGLNAGRNVVGSVNSAFGFDAGSRIGKSTQTTCAFAPYYCRDGGGNGSNNVAFGNVAGSDMKGALNVGIGWKAGNTVDGFNNVGIGPLAGWTVTGSANVGISSNAGSTVVGHYNLGVGNAAGSRVSGSYNIGLGAGAGVAVNGDNNFASGRNAGQTLIGNSNFASGLNAGRDVFGDSNFATGDGSGRNVTGNHNIAIGSNSGNYLRGTGNIAFGRDAGNGLLGDIHISDRTISMGSESMAWTSYSIALGYQAEAGVKMGADSKAIAIGDKAKATGVNALAMGMGAEARGMNSISIGTGNVVLADGAAAIGDPNYIGASATGAYILGNNNGTLDAPILTPDSFLIGSNIQADQTLASSINLGTGSIAYASGAHTAGTAAYPSVDISGAIFNFAGGTAPAGVVTVGQPGAERRIQNVAAGLISATSTDAINGSQLYALLGAAGGAGGGWNLQADGGTPTYIPPTGIVNAVSGVNTTPVVTGNQLQVNVADNPTFAGTVTTNGLTVNPGGAVNMGGNVIQNVGAGVSPTDAVNLDQLPVVYSDAAGNQTPATPGNHVTMVGAGAPVMIHNVAPGSAPSDAANVSQLPGYWDPAAQNTYMLSNSQAGGAPVTVANVAPGELSPTSTQAVNGSQLYQTNQAINNLANVSGDLQHQINRNNKTANAGISGAMALGQMRYDDRPGKFSMGLGVGTYRSQVGMAIGAGHTSESRLWRFSAGLTWSPTDSRSGVGAAASATYTFN